MSKLKPSWVKTDISKPIKTKFWEVMIDYPTYPSFLGYLNKHMTEFPKEEECYFPLSAQTYKKLKDELKEMPLYEVETLPSYLQSFIFNLRPDLKGERGETQIEQKPYEETPHKQKMRELAKALAEGIRLPSLWDKDLWRDLPVEFEAGKYLLSIGVVEIAENGLMKVSYYGVDAGNAEPHLVKGLFSHLSTSGLSKFAELVGDTGKLGTLADKAGQYSQALLEFLKLIVDEVRGYKDKVNFHDEAKPGLTRRFILTVWNDAIQKASGYSWIDDSWYKSHENIPNTGLWKLRCGVNIIGIAKSKITLKTYEERHKKLRVKYAEHQSAKDIHAKSQEMSNLAQEIRQRLQEFSDIQYLPGHCELC